MKAYNCIHTETSDASKKNSLTWKNNSVAPKYVLKLVL